MTSLNLFAEISKWREKYMVENKLTMQLRYEITELKGKLCTLSQQTRPQKDQARITSYAKSVEKFMS